MDDAMLRKNLVELLEGGNAYAPIDKVLAGISAEPPCPSGRRSAFCVGGAAAHAHRAGGHSPP